MEKIKSPQKNLFSELTLLTLFLFSLTLCSCAPGNEYLDPWNNNSSNCRYGNCAPSYGGTYGNSGYDSNRYGYDRYGHDPYYDKHDYWKNEGNHHHNPYQAPPTYQQPPAYQPPPPPPPQAAPEAVIRPNCPPDTTFDGRHCIIPENRRRPGGKGTVNACPNDMWLSGDRCVKN